MTRRYNSGFEYDQGIIALDSAGDWSMCGWVYFHTYGSGGGDIFFMSDGTYDAGHMTSIGHDAGQVIRFRCGNGTSDILNHAHSFSTGQWYHVAMVYDDSAGTVTAYVDGAQVAQATSVNTTLNYTLCEFGEFGSGTDYEIGQCKLWEGYALSAGELADEIAYWTPQHGTAFVHAWWQFDNADQLADSSSNGHTLSSISGDPVPGSQTVPGQLDSGQVDVAGAMSAAVSMAAVPNLIRAGAGALTATATLAGAPSLTHNAAGALTATATLAGAPELWKNAAGALSASLTMTGATGSIVNVAGALTASVILSGAPRLTKVAAGEMNASITLAGTGVVFPLLQAGWTNPPLGAATPHGPWVSSSAQI